jgi:hypothetical protein
MANCSDGTCTAFCGATSCQNCSGTDGCWGGCGSANPCYYKCTQACAGWCNLGTRDSGGSDDGGGGCSSCKDKCTGGCGNNCDTFCNKGCDTSAMAVTLSRKLDKDNISNIGDLILFELSRRPSITDFTDTSNIFEEKEKVSYLDINTLITNLNLIDGINIPTILPREKALKDLGLTIIEKLLTANEEEIKISK